MKIAFYTLGCKVNQNETGALEQLFCENGFALAGPDEAADVYVDVYKRQASPSAS